MNVPFGVQFGLGQMRYAPNLRYWDTVWIVGISGDRRLKTCRKTWTRADFERIESGGIPKSVES
jgi:hypothetical protein